MFRYIGLCIVLASGLSLSACSTLPEAPASRPTFAAPPGMQGELADIAREIAPEESVFHLLPGAADALSWRLALVDAAESAIDTQYFIWKDDASGTLMLEHIFAAADRGVKVRILIDDMFLSTNGAFSGADVAVAAITFHPNIQVRLFNPGKYRDGILGLAGNFGGNLKAYNRRMHNKVMIVDNHFAILGGRNIGDEYFGLHDSHNFLDLDVLVAGAVVSEASHAFDEYWNSDLAFPGSALTPMDETDYQALRSENSQYVEGHAQRLKRFAPSARADNYFSGILRNEMRAGFALYLQDKPVQRGGREFRLYDMMAELAVPGAQEMILSSPYLIPFGKFLQHVEEDVDAGVQVRLLTNSLGSNDATATHSHYKKYRHDILATGAELYEFHHEPAGDLRQYSDVAPGGDSFVALHMKASVVDGQLCFIGSLNLDPRAVEINTENGLYIESTELCGELQDILSFLLQPENAWSVTENEEGALQWSSYQGTVDRQPAQGLSQRIADFFFRMLPLESQL